MSFRSSTKNSNLESIMLIKLTFCLLSLRSSISDLELMTVTVLVLYIHVFYTNANVLSWKFSVRQGGDQWPHRLARHLIYEWSLESMANQLCANPGCRGRPDGKHSRSLKPSWQSRMPPTRYRISAPHNQTPAFKVFLGRKDLRNL